MELRRRDCAQGESKGSTMDSRSQATGRVLLLREHESPIANAALRNVRTRLNGVRPDPLQKGFSKYLASIMIGNLAGESWNLKSARAVLFS